MVNVNYHIRPLVKWAGGKRQILSHLLKHIPDNWNVYYEPFAGGLALLIELYNRNLIRKAVISDLNEELINLYVIVKEKPYDLLDAIKNLDLTNNRETYNKNRRQFNNIRGKKEYVVERAALFLYLNRYCYNGLWRVNKKGEFNVPFGKYKNPRLPSKEDILSFSNMLKLVEIKNEDFEIAVKSAGEGDFIYFDPPYQPVSSTAYFTDYTAGGFSEKDQRRLARVSKELKEKGAFVMISNSDTEFIRNLYREFNIYSIIANRHISSKPESRKNGGKEVIITSY